jgi:uncharacterized protein (DUF2147 family)
MMAAALLVTFLAPCAAQTAAPSQAPSAPPPPRVANGFAGIWFDDKGDGAIEIAPCGTFLCGRIVWLRSPNDQAGRPLTDGYNPEAAKRKRPICGLPVIGDLKRQADGAWDAGWIYDPKEGKSYDVELKLRSPDRLQVTGYLGTKFLSESFIWTRAPASIPKCTTTSASNAL